VSLLLGTGTGELEELVACFAVEDDQLRKEVRRISEDVEMLKDQLAITFPSAPPVANFSPSGEYLTTLTNLSCSSMVRFHLKGGPSKKQIELSSLPTTALNGRVGLKSTELIGFDVPMISPVLVPVSALNT